jgi:hypothetical protein
VILILRGILSLRLSSSSATQSITFTTCHLPPTSTFFWKPSSLRKPLALPSSTIFLAFSETSSPSSCPLEYVLHKLRRQCLPSPLRRVKPSGVFKTLPKDIHIAVAIPLRHPHQLVHKEGEVCGPGEVPGVQPAEAVWEMALVYVSKLEEEMALAEALLATAVLGGGG